MSEVSSFIWMYDYRSHCALFMYCPLLQPHALRVSQGIHFLPKPHTLRLHHVTSPIPPPPLPSSQMRLLLPPLTASWPAAGSLGPLPCSSLLLLLSSAVAAADRSAASAHTAAVFDFLLRSVLDVRRQGQRHAPTHTHDGAHNGASVHALPASSTAEDGVAVGDKHSQLQQQQPWQQAGSVGGVEGAAVCALVSLSLKCSESSFRPLFVALVEWAAAGFAAGGEAVGAEGRVQRHITLFGLVNGLSDRLK